MRALIFMMGVAIASMTAPVGSVRESDRFRGARFISWTDFSRFTRENGSVPGEIVLTSPEVEPGFSWNELIVSWNVELPADGCLRIEARVLYPDHTSRYYVMGLWSGDRTRNPRESVENQKDADGEVQTDTLVLKNPGKKAQIRLTISGADPSTVRHIGACFADTKRKAEPQKPNKSAWGKVIDVPERSQLSYQGGRGWCSPTSTCMTMNYWGKKLNRGDLGEDVPAVAAGVDDPKWPGTGNWPFNTAYAGSFPGIRAYVTRFSDLSEVEDWIQAGVPVIMSVLPRLLTGSDSASNGHLIVAVGFTNDGDLVANDPWARLEKGQPVRRIYRRHNVAAAWAVSNNTVYLIYPEAWKVPKDHYCHWLGR